MDTVAVAARRDDSLIILYSHGYDGVFEVDIRDLEVKEDERKPPMH